MKIFIGMETSGELRRRFSALGHDVISCDILPAQDAPVTQGRHIIGDVFEVLEKLRMLGWFPDAAIFHPTCTYLTTSAAWAFNDPDFIRYPGVGYHQKVKPGTLTGQARRDAREKAVADVKRIAALPISVKIIENPVGYLSSMFMKPTQVIQPYEFGDDASKKTCLWILTKDNQHMEPLIIDPAKRKAGRITAKGKERWSNQTDEGQNNLGPSDDRWSDRSNTFPGVADGITTYITSPAYH